MTEPAGCPPGSEDRSFSIGRANGIAVFGFIPPLVLLALLYVAIHGGRSLFDPLRDASLLVTLVLLLGGIAAHELLHLVAWKLAARPSAGALRLGFQWRTLTPYAHCDEPMSARAYLIGAATPGVVLGLLPVAIGLLAGWGGWMWFGLLFTLAAGGDALILWLLRDVPASRMVIDHPSRAGCIVLADA